MQNVQLVQWAATSLARNDGDRGHRQSDHQDGQQYQRQYEDPSQRGGYYGQPQQDDGRRNGKMTPEERRELRRQINEAGQNIYRPQR